MITVTFTQEEAALIIRILGVHRHVATVNTKEYESLGTFNRWADDAVATDDIIKRIQKAFDREDTNENT